MKSLVMLKLVHLLLRYFMIHILMILKPNNINVLFSVAVAFKYVNLVNNNCFKKNVQYD